MWCWWCSDSVVGCVEQQDGDGGGSHRGPLRSFELFWLWRRTSLLLKMASKKSIFKWRERWPASCSQLNRNVLGPFSLLLVTGLIHHSTHTQDQHSDWVLASQP
jgi:hypothetical protein